MENPDILFTKTARKEFLALKMNRARIFGIDDYLDFLCQFNDFMNHAPKPFHPMTGNNFKL